MNSEAFGAMFRTILQFVTGYLVAKGIGDAALWATVVPAAVAIGSAFWSFYWVQKKTTPGA